MADQNSNTNRGNQGGGRRNPADNLTHEDRVRGGERSAAMQQRDASGQFAGRKNADNRGGAAHNRTGGGGSAGRNAGNGNSNPGGNR